MKRLFISLAALALIAVMCAGLAAPAYAEGTSPVAENLELVTYREVTVAGTLSAYDPDGDVVGYEITTQPVKGLIQMLGDGSFTYTPGEGKKGKDYFGYKAVDGQGNYSQEATVIIKIQKQRKAVAYSDMEGLAGEYYAVALSEHGIFTGRQVCGEYCFCPDEPVSRGEFVSMCMAVSGEPVLSGAVSTGYSDDGSIPDWMKRYAMTASMCKVDEGVGCGEERMFNPSSPISRSDAALILNKALKLCDVSYMTLDEGLEPETAQACANLSASGIIREGTLIQESLDRADAAELLVKALELIKKR